MIRFYEEIFTPSGVRLRRVSQNNGLRPWLFLPGGPGIGSDSLFELAHNLPVDGPAWLVDLPNDGSNILLGPDPYTDWPQVLIEAAQALPGSVFLGHSTGGMYLLSTPALESLISGLVLISTAPDSRWHRHFVAMTERHPLPAVNLASEVYAAEKTNANLAAVAVASAEWNFGEGTVETGRNLLARMPYNYEAVDWSDAHFDYIYAATWWPERLPVLIVSGSDDRIVDQSLWDSPRFQGGNVRHVIIDTGAHFPWIERPDAVRQAFMDFNSLL